MTPALCVIVPVYNAQATLDACVRSVLSQTVPGGLCCLLVDDGSTDASPALCDAFAAADPRVRVVHQAGGGVSRARNAGLRAAPAGADSIVFLDSDDHLLPGALQTALTAQAAHPGSLVLWQYDTGSAERLAALELAGPGAPTRLLPQSALARLYLDCVIGMPWNKLYRADLIRRAGLKFNESYTLGEDLQFVLDYLAALRAAQPDFTYAMVDAALTYYDCSKTDGTLSTRYLPDYCAVWPRHFARLNEACAAAACPGADLLPLHRAELAVLAEGVADILRRDPAQMGRRRDKADAALRDPWLRALLRQMKAEGSYSPYYLPVLWRNQHLVYTMAEARRRGSPLFGKLDWAGYYLLGGRRARD